MGEKIKILQVTGSLRIGGMENVAMNIIRYIDRDKYDVRYVVYGDSIGEYEAEVKSLGGEVYHISYPHEGIIKYYNNLKKIIKTTGPYKVVHSHNLFPTGMVMLAAKRCNVPIRIAHSHTNRNDKDINLYRHIYQWLMRILIRKNATEWFACSKRAGIYLFGDNFLKTGFVMQNGVDTNKFIISNEIREKLLKDFGITTEKVVGHIGRFIEVKNHEFLLSVFAKALKNNNKNLKLLLVGDGPLRENIQLKAQHLGIEDNVIFAGMRNDIPELLSIMDVYVLPSLYEGVSVSLIEAQAAGVPFVVSKNAYSDESKVTDYGVQLGLNEPVDKWTNSIIEQISRGKLANAREIIKNKGYDVESIIRNVQSNYYI